MADVIGLTAILVEVVLMAILFRLADISVWFWMILFALLSITAMILWHGETKTYNRRQWFKFILASLLVGALFYLIDMVTQYSSRPGNIQISGGLKSGGVLGLGFTLIVCPGMAMIGLASQVRLFWKQRNSSGDGMGKAAR